MRQQQRRASINEQQQHRAALLIQRQLASKLRSKSEAKQQLAKLEEAKLTIDEDERESLTQAIGIADQRIAERRSEVAALTRAMADVKAGLADTQRRSESLELAMSESKSANLKLNDPQVTAAVTTMAKSLHLLGERVAAGRLAVADHAQRLAAATSEVEQQCAARDQLIERQKGYAEQRAEIELEMKAMPRGLTWSMLKPSWLIRGCVAHWSSDLSCGPSFRFLLSSWPAAPLPRSN